MDEPLNQIRIAKSDLAGKYLSFAAAGAEYGLNILEIVGVPSITPILHAPGQVKGVVKLRGKVIPIVDLRNEIDPDQDGSDHKTCIAVVEFQAAEQITLIGIVVDAVSEVLNPELKNMEPTPAVITGRHTHSLQGTFDAPEEVEIKPDLERASAKMNFIQVQTESPEDASV